MFGATPLGGDAPPQAEQRYQIGVQLYGQEKYAEAAREFKAAQTLYPQSPRLAYNLARSLERAGQIEDAITHYLQYLDLAPEADDRVAVEGFITSLEAQRPEVMITSEPTGAKVFLNEEEVPRGVTPLTIKLPAGTHVARLEYEQRRAVEKVEAVMGRRNASHVTIAAAPEPAPVEPAVGSARPAESTAEWMKPVGWTAIGLGAVATGLGVYFTMQASSAVDEAGGLDVRQRARYLALGDDIDSYNAGMIVSYSLGAALIGTGVVMLVLADDGPVSAGLTPGGAWASVRW